MKSMFGSVGNSPKNSDKDDVDFYNIKNSKYSEGSSKTSGASSAEPGGKGMNGDVSTDNEPARLKRNGISNTNSGPKPTSTNPAGSSVGGSDFPFLQHTQKDN